MVLKAARPLAFAQGGCLLINFKALLLEHSHYPPAQFLHRLEEGPFHIPGIDGDRVEEPHPVESSHSAQ